MQLLYLDDSGSSKNPKERHLVLGGVSLAEPQIHWVTQKLDELAQSIDPNNPHGIEFHASEIFSGRVAPWDKMKSKEERVGVIKAVLKILADSYESARAFAYAVEKSTCSPGVDPMQDAFEDLCSRFDHYLSRVAAAGERHRGLLILDETTYETTLREMARNFRLLGTRWRAIRHLAEVPLFVPSHASRCVQLADHVAYAVFRRFEAGDSQYFDIIASKFDASNNVVHGLIHRTADRACMCPACLSRRSARSSSEPSAT
jgi:hypothetical protein